MSDAKLLPLRVRLPYQSEDEFLTRYGANVARGGIFIATRAPKPEGTALAFEFLLADGTRMLRGEGVVVKVQGDEASGRTGMTVRFTRLDAPSKALVDRILARRAQGAKPAAPPSAPSAPAPEEQGAEAAPSVSTMMRLDSLPAPLAAAIRAGTNGAPASESPPAAPPPPPAARPAPARPAPAAAPELERAPAAAAGPGAAPAPARPAAAPGTAARPAAGAASAAPAPAAERTPLASAPAAERAPAPPPGAEPSPLPPRSEAPAARAAAAPQQPRAPDAGPSAPSALNGPAAAQARGPELEAPRRREPAALPPPAAVSASPTGDEPVLGIDLGAHSARAAVFHEGRAQLVPLTDAGAPSLPTAVALDPSGREFRLGEAALASELYGAAIALPRLLGLRAPSAALQALVERIPLTVSPDGQGEVAVDLGARDVPVLELTSRLVGLLKARAEALLGRPVTRAVLCAPAYFSDRQRAALREAAARAGLQVLRIVNAPSAAALAYGAGRGLARKRLLVMDLGASAVDAAVVQITGDDLEVITTGGDLSLGGLDFDARVADMLAALLRAYGGSPSGDVLTLQQLRRAAERMKVTLSTEEEALMPEVSLGAGAPTEPLPPLSRERLHVVTADLADRVALAARTVLEGAALGPQGLDSVLLVGGLSQSPQVRRRVQELLGVPVQTDVDPLGAPALGAALLGHSLAQAQASGKPGARVSDVLSTPIGVAERSGALHTVLARNTRLPAEKSLVVQVQPGPVALALFQGPSIVAQDNEFLGTVFLILERGGELQLHFSVSTDGTLALAATLPGGRRQPVTLDARDPGDVARAELVARSPLGQEPVDEPERQAGLLTGIKKLFGR